MSDKMTLYDELRTALHGLDADLIENEPLKEHCTFKIGGSAEVFLCPKSEKALIKALEVVSRRGDKLTVLGSGSNVLISDKGLSGLTVKLTGGLTDIIYLGDGVIGCSAGVPLSRLCTFALDKELAGLEFAYGIPGSVGGAVYMNAGAYGGEMKDVLLSVRSVSKDGTGLLETPASEMDISYRKTPFMTNGRIVTAAYFQLKPGEREDILGRMTELMNKRKASQPLDYPSAGSTFKRPENGYAAAHIDECGLKGLSHGGARVSEKHAGFIINTGNAASDDVLSLINEVKAVVLEKHGVELTPEVEYLSD